MRNNIDTILSNAIDAAFEQARSNMSNGFAKHQQKILSKQNEKNTNLVNMFNQFSNKQEENKNQQSAIKNYNLVDDPLDRPIFDIEKCNIELNLEEQDDKQIDLPNSNDTCRSTQSKHRHPTQHKKSIKPNINSCIHRTYNLRQRPVKVEERSNAILLTSKINELAVIAYKLFKYLQEDEKKIHEAREAVKRLNEISEYKSLLIELLYRYIERLQETHLKSDKLHDILDKLIAKVQDYNNMGPKNQIVKDFKSIKKISEVSKDKLQAVDDKLTIISLLTQLQSAKKSNLEGDIKPQPNNNHKFLELIDQNVNIQGNNNSQNIKTFQQFVSVQNISKYKQQGKLQLKIRI